MSGAIDPFPIQPGTTCWAEVDQVRSSARPNVVRVAHGGTRTSGKGHVITCCPTRAGLSGISPSTKYSTCTECAVDTCKPCEYMYSTPQVPIKHLYKVISAMGRVLLPADSVSRYVFPGHFAERALLYDVHGG
jgi:hypothetical protein